MSGSLVLGLVSAGVQRCPDSPASAAVLPAGRSGYLQAVHPEPLIRSAARQDLVVWLARQVGGHVVAGTPLAFAWRRDLDQPAADAQALQAALAAAVASGSERTMVQDVPSGSGMATNRERPSPHHPTAARTGQGAP